MNAAFFFLTHINAIKPIFAFSCIASHHWIHGGSGKVLLSQKDGKAALPTTTTDDNTNAVSTIQQFLVDNAIDAQLGAVFSIYENTKTNINYIFYRAIANSPETNGLGAYVAIDDIAKQEFGTSAMNSMMTRYATESENGLYGVYVGQEEKGRVH